MGLGFRVAEGSGFKGLRVLGLRVYALATRTPPDDVLCSKCFGFKVLGFFHSYLGFRFQGLKYIS